MILEHYDPSKYLLSHATIVASVDVGASTKPLGRSYEDGAEINRQYSDYLISPETAQYINGNWDAFERQALLRSYKTFIGAQSYVEHVQIPELSKGRIIDAAARDLGDTVYIDILIANELKHKDLIEQIKSGKLGTLSMGCFTPNTLVSLEDGSRTPINTIKLGDKVLTHKGDAKEVTNIQIHIGQYQLLELTVEGIAPINLTRNHPVFIRENDLTCEVEAQTLRVGDLMIAPETSELKPITHIETKTYWGEVYDLEVEDHHSYLVEGLAVHNCKVEFCICSQCGNVARDETENCHHIQYLKGTEWIDPNGVSRRVAELCGHHTAEGSVQFIEASWVADPAFKGAVLRNVLKPEGNEIQLVDKIKTAISTNHIRSFDKGFEKKAVQQTPDQLDAMVDDLVKPKTPKSNPLYSVDPTSENDNLVKLAIIRSPKFKRLAKYVRREVGDRNTYRVLSGLIRYQQGGWGKVLTAHYNGDELLGIGHIVDRIANKKRITREKQIYSAVIKTGGTAQYPNQHQYLKACSRALGRVLTADEASMLIQKGRLYSRGRA